MSKIFLHFPSLVVDMVFPYGYLSNHNLETWGLLSLTRHLLHYLYGFIIKSSPL